MWSLWKVQRSWFKECEALNLGSPTPWTQNSHHEATKPHSHKRTRQVVEINISLSYCTLRKSLPYDIWTEAHFALWMRISPYLVCIHLYTATLYNPYTNIHFLKGSRLLKGEGVKEWLSTQAIPRWHNNGRTLKQNRTKRRTRGQDAMFFSSCIQDIGSQIGFRWRGEWHLLCIQQPLAPTLSEQRSTLLLTFTKGGDGWVRNLNIWYIFIFKKVLRLCWNLSGWWSPVSPGICKDEINESQVLTRTPRAHASFP